MAAPSFTTIIFDLSEVLISGLVGIEKNLSARLEIPSQGILEAFGGRPLEDLCCRRLTENAYLTQLLAKQGWNVSSQELKALIRSHFRQRVPGMHRILSTLAGRYELVLHSDHAEEWVAYIQEVHPFLRVFARQFYSYQLKQLKNDPSTFKLVLKTLRRQPQQCLLIDDNPANLSAAEKAGLQGMRFIGAGDLYRRLVEMGLISSES